MSTLSSCRRHNLILFFLVSFNLLLRVTDTYVRLCTTFLCFCFAHAPSRLTHRNVCTEYDELRRFVTQHFTFTRHYNRLTAVRCTLGLLQHILTRGAHKHTHAQAHTYNINSKRVLCVVCTLDAMECLHLQRFTLGKLVTGGRDGKPGLRKF